MTKQWRHRIGLMVLGLIIITSIPVLANQAEKSWIVDDAPKRYTVKHDDTLWDIASKFLHDPWRWQAIWHSNPDIDNPNLIYPGDTLILEYVEDKPQLRVERKNLVTRTNQGNGVIKLRPRVRVLPAESAIPTIPLYAIEPFLNNSRIVTEQQATTCPLIVAVDEDHLVVGTGDRIYVSGLPANSQDKVYAVFRPGKLYRDPKTRAPLGLEGIVLGQVALEVPGETARLIITKSNLEIRMGDRLISTIVENIDPYFIPKFPEAPAKGQIISVFGGLTQIGQFQILTITGGTDAKRQVGDVLNIYQTKKDIPYRLSLDTEKKYYFPPLKTGRCIVFRVFNKVSYVLVMNATRPIYLLDAVDRT